MHVVQYLLSLGANPNTISDTGFYPLFIAVSKNHFQIVKLLVEANANPNFGAAHNKNIMLAAAKSNNETMFSYLMDHSNVDFNPQELNSSALVLTPKMRKLVKSIREMTIVIREASETLTAFIVRYMSKANNLHQRCMYRLQEAQCKQACKFLPLKNVLFEYLDIVYNEFLRLDDGFSLASFISTLTVRLVRPSMFLQLQREYYPCDVQFVTK